MHNLSRRQFFQRSLMATAFTMLPVPLFAASRPPLWIPPLFESRRGKPILLTMNSNQTALIDNKLVETWGFNGHYLGPTVKVKQGDFVKLTYRNNLSQLVAMNVQGLQAASELIGGIGHSFKMHESWSPIVPITQPAGLCYYQSCTLASSAYQNYRGLVGMWIVEDEESRKSSLPNKYGVNDIPLILQDQQINRQGLQLFQANENHFYGERLFVNGQEAPFLSVPRGWVRLRILNASLSRAYELRMEDEREMQLIAQDQGFLPQAKKVNAVQLGAGERIEILVDLSDGEQVALIAGKKRGFIEKAKLFFHSDGELADNTLLELRPEGMATAFHHQPSIQSSQTAVRPTEIAEERRFHLDADNGTINQQRFDPRRIDITAKKGSVERWQISTNGYAGFRIQGAKFLIESRGEQATPDNELVWKDTIWLNGSVSLLVKFDNISSNTHPFIFGSADLMQADKGAFGLLVVQ